MRSCRLSDRWAEWINKSLPTLAPKDQATWELTMGAGPKGPIFILAVFMPGVVFGTTMHTSVSVNAPQGATEAQVVGFIGDMVRMLDGERRKQLAAGQPPPNGAGGGLILPS